MTPEREERAITETEIGDIYTENCTAATADSTPKTNRNVIEDAFVDGKASSGIDSNCRPESILFIQTEFDLERLERQLLDWSQKNNSLTSSTGKMCQDVTIGSLVSINQGEIFQERDSKDPPLTYSFNRSKFYIRACYKVYYDLIIACLKTGRIDFLTLIGSPGTGKSMLYLYVYRQFRRENPNVTVVVAAFNEASNLLECWEYKPGEDPKRCSKIPEIRDSVHFYDGTPSMLPRYQKMVCFTCLDYKWIDLHIKEPRHECLWFPPWTLDELLDADEVCGLGLGKETITTRFNFFGGSARYCLSSDDEYVERGRQLVLRKAASIYSKVQLEACLLGGVNDTLSHDVFHLIPEISNIFPFVSLETQLFACSQSVDNLICKQIMKKTSYNELIDIVRCLPQTSKIRGGIFQQSVHHQLQQGGSFELQSLDGSGENLTVTVPPGIYQEMQSHHCGSVGGVVVMNNTVLLFQPTVERIHGIDGHEILQILKSVEKFDDFVNGINVDVLLIFVIPKGLKNFEIQEINPIEFNHDDCSVGRVGSMRHSWSQQLVRNNVTTVKDLRAYITDPNHGDRGKYTKYIDDFDERNANSKYNDKLQRIRKYVVVLNEVDEQRNEDWLENLRNHIRDLCEFA